MCWVDMKNQAALSCKAIRAWARDLDGILGKGRIWADVRQAVDEEAAVLGSWW